MPLILALALAMQMPDLTDGPEPRGKAETWINSNDYPPTALAKSGVSELEIFVDPDGRAAGCRIKRASGVADFERQACRALETRGRWKPAFDPGGKPIMSVYRRKVQWVSGQAAGPVRPAPQYPDMEIEVARLPVPPVQAFVVVRQIQRADGTLEHCEVTSPSPSTALNAAACKLAAPLAGTEPIFDKAGSPVRGARWRIIRFMEKRATPAG